MGEWNVGAVSVTAIVDTEASLPCEILFPNSSEAELGDFPWVTPFRDANGHVRLTLQSFLVRAGDRAILVDLCVGNDKERAFPGFHMLKTNFVEQLASLGLTPGDIDTVVYTHLHGDHVGWGTTLVEGEWKPTFANARFFIDRAECEYWEKQQDSPDDRQSFEDSVRPVIDAGLVEFVDDDVSIADGISFVRSRGHTPGHRSVRIMSDGAEAIITGDIAHSPAQIARPDWSCFLDYDAAQSAQTREAVLADAAHRGLLVIGTHFPPPTAGHVVPEGDGYRFEVVRQ